MLVLRALLRMFGLRSLELREKRHRLILSPRDRYPVPLDLTHPDRIFRAEAHTKSHSDHGGY